MNPFSWWRMIYWRFRWYVYPRRRYVTRCQYCRKSTGRTMHAWATEDVCEACDPYRWMSNAEYVVETGDVGGP